MEEIQIKGRLLTSISLCEKLHVMKLGYTVKFLEAVCFRKFQAAVPKNEVRHKEVAE